MPGKTWRLPFIVVALVAALVDCPVAPGQAAAFQDGPLTQIDAAQKKASGGKSRRHKSGGRKGGAPVQRSSAARPAASSGPAHMIEVERAGARAFSAAPAKR